jgi:hypothetical protein
VPTLRRIAGDLLWDGGCHPLLMRAGDSLAAGRGDDAIPWFQWALDNLTHELGPDHPDVIEAGCRLGHALVAALQFPAAITVLERGPQFEQASGTGMPTGSARDELAAAYPGTGSVPRRNHPLLVHAGRLGACPGRPDNDYAHGLVGSYLASARAKEALARPTSGWRRTGSAFLGLITWTRCGAERLRRRLPEDGQDCGRGAACEQAWAGFERVLGPGIPMRCGAVRRWPRCTANWGAMATSARAAPRHGPPPGAHLARGRSADHRTAPESGRHRGLWLGTGMLRGLSRSTRCSCRLPGLSRTRGCGGTAGRAFSASCRRQSLITPGCWRSSRATRRRTGCSGC